ncbi:dolichyl-diphosphooligosaccharide--protein glycotransferase subunit OST1 NDAI_0C02440 [Naumovozyma dairenensis CBS 421]|uniref:Dolichyl-diphosphooligosaccharide--protein glycosyltransferase subunit 1 n=1 Tax=Naumovozyma dairenensis (strain ATCC 10597 / BCRC 20456 / CBS 421 / NBRC 0211 / NRRL Y-12639) TaxID=1071378 RepID=G0W7Z3_NAUDC|nr:hypothetical protein NDAI_0C02440 [Naumovozyma dairenensis CBS 421]CCD23904.1 hypothetical protein NDAI_0C02440 [Naumovozyma dairenensis CBS 421]
MNASIFWWVFITFFIHMNSVLCIENFIPEQVWENIDYRRAIDVSKSYLSERVEIRAKNVGPESVTEYYFALPRNSLGKVSMFTAVIQGTDTYLNCQLFPNVTRLEETGEYVGYGVINFPSPIQPEQEFSFITALYYNVAGVPYPEYIAISDEQSLLLKTNRFPISAYPTVESTLTIGGSSSFEELNAPDDAYLKGKTNVPPNEEAIFFGPWDDIKPFEKEQDVEVVFNHNLPLNEVTLLKRDIWVSQWASTLEFKEYYELKNKGAKLDKGFSRINYMRDQQQADMRKSHYLAIIEMLLPENPFGHYYNDLVGLVSTAKIQENHYFLKPRFPIFGGWNYNFTIGWTNQLSDFLHKSNDDSDMYLLSVPLLNGPSDTVYDTVEYSVYVPEGAKIADIDTPIPFVNLSVKAEKSYLDLKKGHVRVKITFKNLVNEIAGAKILIKYQYTKNAFIQKPLSIAIYIFIALMFIFLLKNINLNVK